MRPDFRDAAAPHRAAPFLARLVACGLLGRAEALAALLHATAPARLSICLRHARLAARPHTPAIGAIPASPPPSRAQAARDARRALAPLLRSNASRMALADAARRAAHPILEPAEIDSLIAMAMAQHLRGKRRESI